MKKSVLKIVVAGHIDHGKSTLLGRLLLATDSLPDDKLKEMKKISRELGKDTELAYLADQLKEEREKNITIETTEIYMKGKRRDYIFIDTPGHLEFIKNMLTGASHAEAAILIVDAQEGIKEQTLRHAYLIKLLSLSQIIVAVNKMDLVDFDQNRFEQIRDKISSLFDNLKLKSLQVIPLSAKTDENISRPSKKTHWNKGPYLFKAMEALASIDSTQQAPLRFPVQDVYDFLEGSPAVGRITSGQLKKGQDITILPSKKQSRVDNILVFEKKKSSAIVGESIGILLADIVPLKRGDIICDTRTPAKLCRSFKGNMFWLDKDPLTKGDTVTIHCATQECRATVGSIHQRFDPAHLDLLEENAGKICHNEAAVVTFNLEGPSVLENFFDIPELGRFTVDRNDMLQGAGTVLQTHE